MYLVTFHQWFYLQCSILQKICGEWKKMEVALFRFLRNGAIIVRITGLNYCVCVCVGNDILYIHVCDGTVINPPHEIFYQINRCQMCSLKWFNTTGDFWKTFYFSFALQKIYIKRSATAYIQLSTLEKGGRFLGKKKKSQLLSDSSFK